MTLLILLLLLGVAPEPAGPYVVFGLSPEMTDQDLRRKYPGSAHEANFVRLSESEVHDGIGSVNVYQSSGYNSLRINFHRADRSDADYPSCGGVRATLEGAFGEPTAAREYREQRRRGHTYTWKSSEATLALNCFYGEMGQSLAEAIRSSIER